MVSEVKQHVICIVGLGYVGFPLLQEFEKYFTVIGFDVNQKKLEKLRNKVENATITSDPEMIKKADAVIIAVPTPVLKSKQPDLTFITSASKTVGKHLKKGAVVVLESTVYPGVTEQMMGPILEEESAMKCGVDFFIGYSPERVNPGDKKHTIDKITKIVSGMDSETTDRIASFYEKITTVYKAKDIQTAEAAKVIENVQRDLNIALVNELSIMFNKMNIDTKAVLDAAATKWNFIRFTPGLVGGHCIPIDPYYLVYKAQEIGYHPQVILAGRSVNDSMPKHVADLTIKALNDAGKVIRNSKILIMGLTFKENVDDTRSSPSKRIIQELKEFHCDVYGYDPLLSLEEVSEFNLKAVKDPREETFDAIIITVFHDEFKSLSLDDLKEMMNENPVLIDVRHTFTKSDAEEKGFYYKTL